MRQGIVDSAQDWRRLLSSIRQGLTTYSAAAVAHEEQTAAIALRSRQVRPRRIAVIGCGGGVGTTTTAVLLAGVLAASREDKTMVFTMHSDANDVAARLAIPHAPSVTEVLASLRHHGQIPPTPLTRNGLRVLSAPPPGGATPEPGLPDLLDVAASGHANVVVDAGVASRIGDLATVVELFDTVLLTSGTSPDAISAMRGVVGRSRACLPSGSPTRLILVAVRGRGAAGADGASTEWQLPDGIPIHVLAHDPELGRGQAIELSLLGGPSLKSVLVLGADVMSTR